MTISEGLKTLVEIDRDITKWVKALPVVDLANFRRIREKRSRVVATIQAMGYKAR